MEQQRELRNGIVSPFRIEHVNYGCPRVRSRAVHRLRSPRLAPPFPFAA